MATRKAASSGRFILLAPTEGEQAGDDETTLGHDAVTRYGSLDDARPDAIRAAIQVGRERDVRVHELGTNNVVSFQYHPEEPIFEGLTASFEPILRWPVWVREVEDTSERVPVYTDDDPPQISKYEKRGGLKITDHNVVPDEYAEGGDK